MEHSNKFTRLDVWKWQEKHKQRLYTIHHRRHEDAQFMCSGDMECVVKQAKKEVYRGYNVEKAVKAYNELWKDGPIEP